MGCARVETLDGRRLLSAGVTAVGNPVAIATIPGQFAPFATCGIGSNDNLVVYVKSGVLDGAIFDASGKKVVAEFPIDAASDNPNPYGKLSAAEDSNGNALVAYTAQYGGTVELARISPAGKVLDRPSVLLGGVGGSFLTPVVAAGADGVVAVAAVSAGGTGNYQILARAVDASDKTLFAALPISTPGPNHAAGALMSNASLAFEPAAGKFIAAWDEEDLKNTSAGLQDSAEYINANTFTPSGRAGVQHNIATAPNTSTSDNVLRKPILIVDPNGAVSVYYTEDDFGPPPSYNFGGSHLFVASLNADASLNGAPGDIYQTTAPNQIQLTSVQKYSAAPQAVPQGNISALGVPTVPPFHWILFDQGTYTGNFNDQGSRSMLRQGGRTLSVAEFSARVQDAIAQGFGWGCFFGEYMPTDGATTLYHQQSSTGGYQLPAEVSISKTGTIVTMNGKKFIQFTFTASKPSASDTVITVNNDAHFGYFTGLQGRYTIPAGQTSVAANIDLSANAPPTPQTIKITITSASGDVIGNAVGIGTYGPGDATPETATPGKPVTVAEAGGNVLISTDAGAVTTTMDNKGDLYLKISGTNGKSKVAIVPQGSAVGIAIKDLISASPIGTVDAKNVNVTGNISIPGVGVATFGDIKDNHQIALGALNGAVLTFGNVASSYLTSTGSIRSLTFASWAGGSIKAGTISTLSCRGNLDADLSVTSVGTLTVGGILGGTSASDYRRVAASASFGAVTVGGLENAALFAGVSSSISGLPTTAAAFVNAAAFIQSLTFTGASAIFADADVAATTIDSITITGLHPANPKTFGVTARKILQYRRGTLVKKNVRSPMTIDSSGKYLARTV